MKIIIECEVDPDDISFEIRIMQFIKDIEGALQKQTRGNVISVKFEKETR